jgi:tocopherol O-methyltransferase
VLGSFDFVWICEVLSHFSRKDKFFSSAQRVLKPQGRIILADWFKAPNLSQEQHDKYVVPIEQGYASPSTQWHHSPLTSSTNVPY